MWWSVIPHGNLPRRLSAGLPWGTCCTTTYFPPCEIENDNLDAYLHDDEEDLGQGV